MKKNIYITFFLSLMLSCNSFAVTEQIESAQKFLDNQSLTNDRVNNSTLPSLNSSFSLAPDKELRAGFRNELLKKLQLQSSLEPTGLIDKETFNYFRQFQKDNGLNVTETLDYNTWFAMFEQSDLWKKDTVEKSLQIWQDIITKQNESSSKKFIVVNIPNMTLTAYDWDGISATETIQSKVVLGKPATQTPLKHFEIVAIKYNPTWTPTDGILKRGPYKTGKLDIDWVKKHGLVAFNSKNQQIDLDNLNDKEKYRFQQPSGDKNALGILKFETNSSDNIYLHDTNEKYYFTYNTRLYSSGCIRVQKFKELANWIRNNNDVDNKLKRKDTYYEKITKTPVYITYSQVTFKNEQPVFSPDIYDINKNTDFVK